MKLSIFVSVNLLIIVLLSILQCDLVGTKGWNGMNLDEPAIRSFILHKHSRNYAELAKHQSRKECENHQKSYVEVRNSLQRNFKTMNNNGTFKTETLTDCMKYCDSLFDCVAWSYDTTHDSNNKNCLVFSEKGPFLSVTDTHGEVCDDRNSSVVEIARKNDYRRLVSLLREAAQLEHSLLNAYLYAASTIKTTPHEFEKLAGVGNNRRAAIQFERARAWKESILLVAREEMLHLHYVQCMLRGLGERPHFALPKRHFITGNWLFPNWRVAAGETQVDDDPGVQIPIAPFTLDNIRRFVLYESSDTLQDNGIFTTKTISMLENVFEFETRFQIGSMLLNVEDETVRKDLADKLYLVYTSLRPLAEKNEERKRMRRQEPALKEFRFQSIAALYQKAIKPLYEQAFRNKWVINNNRNLVDELLSPEFNSERVIPTGPVYRSQNSDSFAQHNKRRYHVDAKTIDDIISEIVEEGEGTTNFEENGQGLLDKVQELGGADTYLKLWLAERQGNTSSRSWLEKYEKLRQSHLYRFTMILTAFQQEKKLSEDVGLNYEVHRQPLDIGNNTALMDLTEQLPFYFNACYLVMIMWLSRVYESANWQSDQSRRHAIEMLTTFPIMSLGIRPFLELTSFFPIEKLKLFSLDTADLPQLSAHAKQLHALYMGVERTETIIKQLDNLALHTLDDIAHWADEQITSVNQSNLHSHERNMILTRLTTLAVLREFKKQFPFRKHDGFSDDLPDFTYQHGYSNSHTFEENPFKDCGGDTKKLYEDVLLLRIRFSGWGRAQLPTDPDPPNDESGCTGIHRLHASDGHRTLNRALIWQQHQDDTEIVRGPAAALPEIGVNSVDITLMAAGKNAILSYEELRPSDDTLSKKMNQKLSIGGLHKIWRFEPRDITGANKKKIRIHLMEKNGYKPLLLGENHLVWKNGEPIDPFIIGVTIDVEDKNQSVLAFQREIFNMNKRMINMEPLERALTARGPVSFSTVKQIPAWAKHHLSADHVKLFAQQEYPMNYLAQRARQLGNAIGSALETNIEQLNPDDVAEIISLAERMLRISVPKPNTIAWLDLFANYAHTISGILETVEDNPILTTIRNHTGISCTINASKDRRTINSRWFIQYSMGIMDTDALSHFIFGELCIPVTVIGKTQDIRLAHTWSYDINLYHSIAAFACDFSRPFWRNDYVIDKNERILQIDKQILVETLHSDAYTGYLYSQTGFKDIRSSRQCITLTKENSALLVWDIIFTAENTDALMTTIVFFASQIDLADAALREYMESHNDN